MGLFDRKTCSLCGGQIAPLLNRRLADGNMCPQCAQKVSPLLEDCAGRTVQNIREHLIYRQDNEQVARQVNPDVILGDQIKVCIDTARGLFFVTGRQDWVQDNPDMIPLSAVRGCSCDVQEKRTEQYTRDRAGNRVSYRPPRYDVQYVFVMTIEVENPWFSRIRFELSGGQPAERGSELYRHLEQEAQIICHHLTRDRETASPGSRRHGASLPPHMAAAAAAVTAQREEETWVCACGSTNTSKFCPECGKPRPRKVVYRCGRCGYVPEDPENPPRFCPDCGDRFTREDALN